MEINPPWIILIDFNKNFIQQKVSKVNLQKQDRKVHEELFSSYPLFESQKADDERYT